MPHTEDLLAQGIAALKAGRKLEARTFLSTVVQESPGNENAWLWLGAAVSTPRETLSCLKRVLAINPQNAKALAGMRWASAQLERERGHLPSATPSPFPSGSPVLAPTVSPVVEGPSLTPALAIAQSSSQATLVSGAQVTGGFFPNLVIAILSLTLVLGFLFIAGLLYAWLG
jgi:hypothetical protein